MDLESMRTELLGLAAFSTRCRDISQEEFEKYQVALSGSLKLLSTAEPTLKGLGGSPQDVHGYLIKQTTDLRNNIDARFMEIIAQLEKILPDLSEMHERNP